ncbi:hypothetical protein RJT34_18767 [Clitoria ternatea]|uniref:Uncharacterized protein n=1 Tax=Clitoria ternatea TaxID=43366 RepID=A0AAN9JBE6_CLITE
MVKINYCVPIDKYGRGQHARLKPLHQGKDRDNSRMIGELLNNLNKHGIEMWMKLADVDRTTLVDMDERLLGFSETPGESSSGGREYQDGNMHVFPEIGDDVEADTYVNSDKLSNEVLSHYMIEEGVGVQHMNVSKIIMSATSNSNLYSLFLLTSTFSSLRSSFSFLIPPHILCFCIS